MVESANETTYITLPTFRIPLVERVSSISLSILNTDEAPYTITILADKGKQLVELDPRLSRGADDSAGDGLFPDHDTVHANGLFTTDGRCAGLTQFLLMVLALFRRWEDDWAQTLRAMDRIANFRVRGFLSA